MVAYGGSRPAARTGGRGTPRRPPAPRQQRERERERGLGGEQVEGRQAVRELLLAGTRRVREVWVSADLLDPTNEAVNEVLQDIVEIARSVRTPVQPVNRKRLEAQARSEAPQGVIAFAAALPEPNWHADQAAPSACSCSSSPSTASPTRANSGPCCAAAIWRRRARAIIPRHRFAMSR